MPNAINAFALCSGWQGSCPWKAAMGLATDPASGRTCPLCSAESLTAARGSRGGQDVTQALLRIKTADAAAYQTALERLEHFGGRAMRADFEARVRRAEMRRVRAAFRRPAAAAAAVHAEPEHDS